MADEPADESASALRSQLSDMFAKAHDGQVRAVIAEQNLEHVKPEDLRGVKDLDKIADEAVALNQQREAAGQDAMKAILASRGIEDVDQALEILAGNSQGSGGKVDQDAVDRARRVGSSGGPVRTEDLSHIENDGPALMRWAFENEK